MQVSIIEDREELDILSFYLLLFGIGFAVVIRGRFKSNSSLSNEQCQDSRYIKMNYLKNSIIIFILIFTIFVSHVGGKEESLKEIYRIGKVRFIPEITVDETSLPGDTFFESSIKIRYDLILE